MPTFDHIVSLGSFCQTTYQLKKNFPQYKSGIFDWSTTSTVGLVRMFEEDFQNIFKYENLRIVDEDGKKSVMCDYYGIMHYHDFELPKDRIFSPSLQDDGEVRPIFVRAAIQRNIERVAYLYKRLCELSGNVLLVRMSDGLIKNYRQNGSWDDRLVDRFFVALKKLAPGINPTLLLLNTEYNKSHRDDVVVDYVNKYDPKDWRGCDQGWQEMFQRLNISHSPPNMNQDLNEEPSHRLTVERHVYWHLSGESP